MRVLKAPIDIKLEGYILILIGFINYDNQGDSLYENNN